MYRPTCFALLAVLAACGTTTPHYDARFGDAVRQGRVAMTIHQDAPASSDQVAGVDGRAAQETITRYQESFKTPPRPDIVINVNDSR